jgi:hypothetical protein
VRQASRHLAFTPEKVTALVAATILAGAELAVPHFRESFVIRSGASSTVPTCQPLTKAATSEFVGVPVGELALLGAVEDGVAF